jgi:hypothetical protein
MPGKLDGYNFLVSITLKLNISKAKKIRWLMHLDKRAHEMHISAINMNVTYLKDKIIEEDKFISALFTNKGKLITRKFTAEILKL